MTPLLPCPFCGGKAEVVEGSRFSPDWEAYVKCTQCEGRMGQEVNDGFDATFDDAEAAITAWNTRDREVKCKCGIHPAEEPHLCPYAQGLYEDDTSTCTCCHNCTMECAERL